MPSRPVTTCPAVRPAKGRQKCPAPHTPAPHPRRIQRKGLRPAGRIVLSMLPVARGTIRPLPTAVALPETSRVLPAWHAPRFLALFPATNIRHSRASAGRRPCSNVAVPVRGPRSRSLGELPLLRTPPPLCQRESQTRQRSLPRNVKLPECAWPSDIASARSHFFATGRLRAATQPLQLSCVHRLTTLRLAHVVRSHARYRIGSGKAVCAAQAPRVPASLLYLLRVLESLLPPPPVPAGNRELPPTAHHARFRAFLSR